MNVAISASVVQLPASMSIGGSFPRMSSRTSSGIGMRNSVPIAQEKIDRRRSAGPDDAEVTPKGDTFGAAEATVVGEIEKGLRNSQKKIKTWALFVANQVKFDSAREIAIIEKVVGRRHVVLA
jgi:hypothetical protein